VSEFYTNLKATALNLLKGKGQLLTLSREVSSGFDPVAGENTSSVSTFQGYGAAFNYNKTQIDGAIIESGDIRLILEATDTAPESGDEITIDSIIYRVMSVKVTSPSGVPVIYELQLRK